MQLLKQYFNRYPTRFKKQPPYPVFFEWIFAFIEKSQICNFSDDSTFNRYDDDFDSIIQN